MPLQRLAVFVAALWWGGLSALSFLAVPLLFATLGSPAVAGPAVAGPVAAVTTMGFVLFAMLLAIVQEFGVAQNIVTARASGGSLRLWHGLGTVMVLGQWLCAGAVLWRLSAPRTQAV